MKHIRYINEMDNWATSNRLGDIGGIYDEINEKTIRHSLKHGPPMRVKISPESGYYYMGDASNPKDVVGTVIEFRENGDHPIRVRWDNGTTNSYRYKDLIIVI